MPGMAFGSLFGSQDGALSADYKSAGSNQTEIMLHVNNGGNTWALLYTVPAGFTLYISTIVLALETTGPVIEYIGTGAAASEVVVFRVMLTDYETLVMPMLTPIKFSAGTKISIKVHTAGKPTDFNLIGWLQA